MKEVKRGEQTNSPIHTILANGLASLSYSQKMGGDLHREIGTIGYTISQLFNFGEDNQFHTGIVFQEIVSAGIKIITTDLKFRDFEEKTIKGKMHLDSFQFGEIGVNYNSVRGFLEEGESPYTYTAACPPELEDKWSLHIISSEGQQLLVPIDQIEKFKISTIPQRPY